MAANENTLTDEDGDDGDWIELHNGGATSVDLTGYHLLSDNPDDPQKWAFPPITLPPAAFRVVWVDDKDIASTVGELHANFRISSGGEAVYLYDSSGDLVDASPALAMGADVSIGRAEPGTDAWSYFAVATPGAANTTTPLSRLGGGAGNNAPRRFFYADSVGIDIRATATGDAVRYTLDGSEPNDTSSVWVGGLQITANTVVRAKAFRAGALPSPLITASYIIDDSSSLPVFSLAIPPDEFFGPRGIHTQYWRDAEVGINAEYFTAEREQGINQQLGVKIHAPDSRDQKSLRLYARGRYGKKTVDYPLFSDTDATEFKRLVLRNGGNDGAEERRLHIKDGYAHRLYKQLDPDYFAAAYQPVNVLINGDYRGIYNLRERQDEHYLKTYTGYACDEVDFLEHDYNEPGLRKTICGDWGQWNTLESCLTGNEALETIDCDSVIATIDNVNFIDYQIFEIFIGNQDWLNNNIKFWKPKDHGKWRWVLWDTEYGMGTQVRADSGNPDFDFMRMALDWGGWGDDDYTWMLRNLVRHRAGFRESFATRYSDLLNTIFVPEYVDAEFDTIIQGIEADLPRQLAKYGNKQVDWDTHYEHTRDWLLRRGGFARSNLAVQLGYTDTTFTLGLDVSDPAAGRIRLNTIVIDENLPGWQAQPYPWRGAYFPEIVNTVTALPNAGYHFVGWVGDSISSESELRFNIDSNTTLTAIFERGILADSGGVAINEIMSSNSMTYPDAGGAYPDWFEVYNPSEAAVNLAGAYVSDDPGEPLKWQIPADDSVATTVPPGGYLVLFADRDTDEGAGHVDFNLSKDGEFLSIVRLEDDGSIVYRDSVTFPALMEDQAYGRLPNGGPTWRVTNFATPVAMNTLPTNTSVIADAPYVAVYPNPATDVVHIDLSALSGEATVAIHDGLGRLTSAQSVMGGRVLLLGDTELDRGTNWISISSHGVLHRVVPVFYGPR